MIFGYSIIGAIIVGLILGVLAKFVMPGKPAVPLSHSEQPALTLRSR